MSQPIASGSIGAVRDILAHVVNTGQIEQHTHLTLTVIVDRLDQLAEVLGQSDGTLRFSPSGDLEAAAGEQTTLSLPANLLEALRLLPRAGDAPVDLRRRAYAAWLVTQRPTAPQQEVAARQRYIPLAGRTWRTYRSPCNSPSVAWLALALSSRLNASGCQMWLRPYSDTQPLCCWDRLGVARVLFSGA